MRRTRRRVQAGRAEGQAWGARIVPRMPREPARYAPDWPHLTMRIVSLADLPHLPRPLMSGEQVADGCASSSSLARPGRRPGTLIAQLFLVGASA
jgi:hypothetical protein